MDAMLKSLGRLFDPGRSDPFTTLLPTVMFIWARCLLRPTPCIFLVCMDGMAGAAVLRPSLALSETTGVNRVTFSLHKPTNPQAGVVKETGQDCMLA